MTSQPSRSSRHRTRIRVSSFLNIRVADIHSAYNDRGDRTRRPLPDATDRPRRERSAATCAILTATSSRLGKASLPKAEVERRHVRGKRLGDRRERLVRSHALCALSGVASVAAPSAVHAHTSTGTTPQHGTCPQQRWSRWQTSFQRRYIARGEPRRCMNSTASRSVQAKQPLTER